MLQEKIVQKMAISFLEKYYNNRFFKRKIFAAKEVRTKCIFGGKRADGLLAFQSWFSGKPYVVSMEAKSIKTLPAINPYPDFRRWLWNSMRFGIFLCLGSGFFILAATGNNNLEIFAPILWCIFAGIAFGLLTWNSYRHQTIDVISQLKQYPANEQWLAFSKDAFQALSNEKQQMLTTICKYRGIGLLLVNKKNRTKLLLKPKRKSPWFLERRGGWHWINDYLKYYSKEEEIRCFIYNT